MFLLMFLMIFACTSSLVKESCILSKHTKSVLHNNTDASDANASAIVIDKSFQVHAKFRKTDTNCYSIGHSFHVKSEISTGKKLGDVGAVGASFSDISRPLLFYLASCALLDVVDVLSAKNFNSIPVFLRKKGMLYI